MASPLVLGISYQLVVVKESTWFAGQEPLIDWKFLAVSWLMGIVMLNTWSFLLYFEFFTRRFWKNVGNGILEPPVEDNALLNVQGNNDGRNVGAAAAADNNQAEHREMESWHGKHGRVARYFHTWQAVLDGWQWDIVDKTVLLDDFTRPVAKQLASALLGSFLSFQVLHILLISVFSTQEDGINMPLLGVIGTGTVNQFVLRFCMTVHIAVQIIANSQESILCAFEIAHEAARDDRYLVGELLMNFNRDEYAS
jgi:E3 ubiquitin-protein ligase MARCH6